MDDSSTTSMTPDRAGQCFVGIDVAKAQLDVCLLPGGETFQVDNDTRGIAGLVAQLTRRQPTLIVLEATGKYETKSTLKRG